MVMKPQGELVPSGGGDPIGLTRAVVKIGRRESCDIQLPYPNVSGIHCELKFVEGRWFIQDLGSTNGTRVNGTRVQRQALRPGDEIAIAKRSYRIVYDLQGGPEKEEPEQLEDVFRKSLLEAAGIVQRE